MIGNDTFRWCPFCSFHYGVARDSTQVNVEYIAEDETVREIATEATRLNTEMLIA